MNLHEYYLRWIKPFEGIARPKPTKNTPQRDHLYSLAKPPKKWDGSRHIYWHKSGDPCRDARYAFAVDTNRWHHGAPEQIQGFFTPDRGRTLRLGLYRALRSGNGVAASKRVKAHTYKLASPVLYYDFSELGQTNALLATMRHMAAYAYGLSQDKNDPVYRLDLGASRELCRTRICDNVYEVLLVECEHGNLRTDVERSGVPDDPKLWSTWVKDQIKRHPPFKRYTFKICRVDGPNQDARPPWYCRLEIALDGVRGLVERLHSVMSRLWMHLVHHPKEVTKRFSRYKEFFARRWQMFHPEHFDTAINHVHYTFAWEPEQALFTHPHVYQGDGGRIARDGQFHLRYLERLSLYQQGLLRWSSKWKVPRCVADDDIEYIGIRAQVRTVAWLKLMAVLVTTKLLLRYFHPPTEHAATPWCAPWSCVPARSRRLLEARQRGPPALSTSSAGPIGDFIFWPNISGRRVGLSESRKNDYIDATTSRTRATHLHKNSQSRCARAKTFYAPLSFLS